MRITKGAWAVIVITAVLLIDQAVKIWIKTHMQLHDSFEITPWFYIYFIENNGMAFGIEFISKLFLTLFRIVAVSAIIYYIVRMIKQGAKTGYIVSLSLVAAGAAGNIFDSLFYGLIFDHSYGQVAEFMPTGGGYASLFHGKVVDMFYFPLFRFNWPQWMPWVGGEEFLFFRPIFNVADSAITIGVILILLFYRQYLSDKKPEPVQSKNEA